MFNRAFQPPYGNSGGSGEKQVSWSYSVDKPYMPAQDHDPAFFTAVLVNAGYRLYQLDVLGIGGAIAKELRVWAKSEPEVTGWRTINLRVVGWDGIEKYEVPETTHGLPDLTEIAQGTVKALPMKGEAFLVRGTDYILLDPDDGGTIVQGYKRERT